ncbi:hypothetical protein SCLCIDRAFT_299756 [Scleroderma citrinum Foug A]|uniref:Uncharacterized protein n=1 Tax=Scleroderma citrinum Foug A TaxID=1036808 RepID=A0A0C3DGE0_9AGAM|nr:hypothetical protein SCLCIDRAFT_299756 [Scleroderma citrinum Foug A]
MAMVKCLWKLSRRRGAMGGYLTVTVEVTVRIRNARKPPVKVGGHPPTPTAYIAFAGVDRVDLYQSILVTDSTRYPVVSCFTQLRASTSRSESAPCLLFVIKSMEYHG